MTRQKTCLVLGGGLAGISAAVRMSQQGWRVTLVETRKRLGGRATSFVDRETDQYVDNCQHVLLGCCSNLLDLYHHLGVRDQVDWHDRLHFFDKHGNHDILFRQDLPAPLHLSFSMLKFKTLTWSEKIAVSQGMVAIMQVGIQGRDNYTNQTFGDWLRANGQPDGAISKFWDVIVVSALNEWSNNVNAAHALQVFQEGFLMHRDAYVMGTSAVPLIRLYDRAVDVIEASGGSVHLRTSVNKLHYDNGKITGVETTTHGNMQADAYISALPFDRIKKVAPDSLVADDERLQGLNEFSVSPILGIHLVFERPVTDHPHLILVDSPLQWVFNKRETKGPGTQYLHCVVSAAYEWIPSSQDEILDMAITELACYAPDARVVPLTHGRVIKEKLATFAPRPGIDAFRPKASGPVPNLFLAGDWCASGWPATMEGAVRTGYRAAGAVVGKNLTVPDLPRAELFDWMGRLPRLAPEL